MRRLLHATIGLILLAAPVAAAAQSDIPPPLVQGLQGPDTPPGSMPWVSAIAGASVAIVGLNAWTAGALLTPAVGPTLSGVLGGSWLGFMSATPATAQAISAQAASAQALFETTTLVASGVSGALVGYWLGNR